MADAVIDVPTRQSRFWLYAPFALLALVAIAWSVAWWVIRDQVTAGLDAWLAAERTAGRQWACQDRTVGGFPFRIQVTCAALTLRSEGATATVGRVRSIAQVYQPRHVIVEAEGPLRVSDGSLTVQGTWRLLEASFRSSPRGFQRLSLVSEGPNFQIIGAGAAELAVSGQRLEAHLRPNPAGQDGAYDVAASVVQAKLPPLDALVGGTEPANLQLDATVTRAEGFMARLLAAELERWRAADGRLRILLLDLVKGPRRLQAKGELRLDEAHRPAGELILSAAGLEGLIANLTGNRIGGNLLGALLGQAARPPGAPASAPTSPAPLPPVRLENGRVAFGPFVLPNVQIPPLY